MARFSDDLENWMAKLPPSIRHEVPLINLAIPGSHDSGTYAITKSSKLAPDAEEAIRVAFPFVPCIVRRWSRTQKFTLQGQLNNGVRFFDLRVAWNSKDQKIYYVHGLYAEEITESFSELYDFLRDHPGEFVIIDFQHFYDFSTPHHQLLIDHIMKFFGSIIFQNDSRACYLPNLTLNRANASGKQLIVTYRNRQHSSPVFFASRDFPTPWPNATKIDAVKEFLDESIQKRKPNQGWITQCVITPDANFIVKKFYSTLKKCCAQKVLKNMEEWLQAKEPGRWKEGELPKINIILGDYVELEDNKFTRMVIDLNMKLL